MKQKKKSDKPIYAALFTEGVIQNFIDKTAGNCLHEIIGKGAESNIIDAAAGVGHRLKAGHDVSGLIKMIEAKGAGDAGTWFQHMFADLMSPAGIPLPGASHLYRFLEETGINLSERTWVDWVCVSATDLVGAGLTLLILARMHKQVSENKRIKKLLGLTVGHVGLLIFAETNPFFVAFIPLQLLLMRHEWRKAHLKRIQERLEESEQIKLKAKETLEMIKRLNNE